jgi:hypothetical protein
MSKGISIHIGLNAIDATHYGTTGALKGCENDANAMKKIADSVAYKSTAILTKDATSTRVLSELFRASQELERGDVLLLTYAGHGAQVKDLTAEEEDGLDETWCLYDRMLLDDELYSMWSKFKPGVKIVVISDSCHSGTITREIFLGDEKVFVYGPAVTYRCLDPKVADAAFNKFKYLYSGIKLNIPRGIESVIGATVMLISGCQDNQLSGDGKDNGLFTSKLLQVWNNGEFTGTYKTFHQQICGLMPPVQTPNYSVIGIIDASFEKRKPFVISEMRSIALGDQDGDDGKWRKLNWSLDVDEAYVNGLSEDELSSYLKGMVDTALMPAYIKFRTIGSQIILPRGGEISGGCSVGDKGWGCEVHGGWTF